MNPWWKRPSSESSSTASRSEAEKRSRSRSRSGDDKNSDDSSGRRRRRGRRGGAKDNNGGNGPSEERKSQGGRGGSSRGRRGGRPNNRSRRGGRRGRGGNRGNASKGQTFAVLVDVEALHKHIKASGGKPEEAGALFSKVGSGVALRAVACGVRKQKVQRALRSLGFDIEQVKGSVEDARLRLALDAIELALGHRGAHIYCLEHQDQPGVLDERLRNHGAEVKYFSVEQPPVIGGDAEAESAKDANEEEGSSEPRRRRGRRGRGRNSDRNPQRDAEAQDSASGASDQEQDGDNTDRDSANEAPGRRRRRAGRRGRRGGRDADAGASTSGEGSEPRAARSNAKDIDPLALLSAAIQKLVAGESQLVWATKVRQEMSGIEPLFNETEHGYDNFEALLREAERRGRITLQKDPRTSTFVIVGWQA